MFSKNLQTAHIHRKNTNNLRKLRKTRNPQILNPQTPDQTKPAKKRLAQFAASRKSELKRNFSQVRPNILTRLNLIHPISRVQFQALILRKPNFIRKSFNATKPAKSVRNENRIGKV